jgi:site-specific DNA-methyltransferase (adenine-specific)
MASDNDSFIDGIYNEDCISGFKAHFKNEQFDLIISDPPFGIGEASFSKHYQRDDANVISGYVEAPDDYASFSVEWLSEAYRALKPDGVICVISGWSNLGHIINAMNNAGFHTFNHVIWKYNFGVNTTKKFVSSHYHLLLATKSKKSKPTFNTYCRFGAQEKDEKGGSLLYQDMQDVWLINKEYVPGGIKNENKLPEELLRKITLYFSNEGDSVCDPFLGNFTTAIVAKKLGRNSFGFELNKNSFDINSKVLAETVFGSELSTLKKVQNIIPANKGKPLTNTEVQKIVRDYDRLINIDSLTKKSAIQKLGDKYGRGRFSILNILSSNNR